MRKIPIRITDEQFSELYNKGLNDVQIAKELTCNNVTVGNRRKKLGLPINFIQNISIMSKETLIELHSKGLNDHEIAKIVGLNHRTIQQTRKELGLKENFNNNLKNTEGNLTYEEEQILLGTVLGDTYLRKRTDISGTGGMFAHSLKQKEYAYWKYEKLKRIARSVPIERKKFHKIYQKTYDRVEVYFRTDSILNPYHSLFYENKVKVIREEMLQKIEGLALAIWFMDDGTKGTAGGYYLCTNSFTEYELHLIIKYFKEKWNFHCNIHNNKNNRRVLYISGLDRDLFNSIVEPHIIDSMRYKLHLDKPKNDRISTTTGEKAYNRAKKKDLFDFDSLVY